MEATIVKSFWENLNGAIECDKHLGCEATAGLAKRKTAKTITTSMTKWFRMTETEVAEFTEFITALNGSTEVCESCRGNY